MRSAARKIKISQKKTITNNYFHDAFLLALSQQLPKTLIKQSYIQIHTHTGAHRTSVMRRREAKTNSTKALHNLIAL